MGQSNPTMFIRKPLRGFIFDGDGNVYPTCHHFRDVRRRNMNGMTLTPWNGPTSNLNMLINSQLATSCSIATVILALSFTVCEIFSRNLGVDVLNWPTSNVHVYANRNPYATSYSLAMAFIAMFVAGWEIITYELLK